MNSVAPEVFLGSLDSLLLVNVRCRNKNGHVDSFIISQATLSPRGATDFV